MELFYSQSREVLPHQVWILWVLGGVLPESRESCHVNSEPCECGMSSLMKELRDAYTSALGLFSVERWATWEYGVLRHHLWILRVWGGVQPKKVGDLVTLTLRGVSLWKSCVSCHMSSISCECEERSVPEIWGSCQITSGSCEWGAGSFPEIAGGPVTSALGLVSVEIRSFSERVESHVT